MTSFRAARASRRWVRTITSRAELSLLAGMDHPTVAAALRQVTERRIDYLTGLFGELGFGEAQARERGSMAYSFSLGHSQLGHAVPSVLPPTEDCPGYLEATMETRLRRDQGGRVGRRQGKSDRHPADRGGADGRRQVND